MTRTLQERPGLPGSARNDPPPEPVGFLSAYPGYRSTAMLDNREHVIGACAKLADALLGAALRRDTQAAVPPS